jgi:hypothetical protein
VESTPTLASANLFADISCDTPLTDDYISLLRTDGPGLSPDEPMALVQGNDASTNSKSVLKPPTPKSGTYIIKNRAKSIFWEAKKDGVYFTTVSSEHAKGSIQMQVNEHPLGLEVFKEITFFQSGLSRMILMVISLLNHDVNKVLHAVVSLGGSSCLPTHFRGK